MNNNIFYNNSGYLYSSLPTLSNWSGYVDVAGIQKPLLKWETKFSNTGPFQQILFGEQDDIVYLANREHDNSNIYPGRQGELVTISAKNGEELNKFQFEKPDIYFSSWFSLAKNNTAVCCIIERDLINRRLFTRSLCKIDLLNNVVLWKFDLNDVTGSRRESMPIILFDENICFTSTHRDAERNPSRGRVISVTKEGMLRWKFPFSDENGNFDILNTDNQGSLYISDQNKLLLLSSDGNVERSVDRSHSLVTMTNLRIDNSGTLYSKIWDTYNGITAFDPQFNELWRYNHISGGEISKFYSICDNFVFFTAVSGSNLIKLNKKTGEKIWQIKTREIGLHAHPIITKNMIYILAGQNIESYDTETGKLIWITKLGKTRTREGLQFLVNGKGQIIVLTAEKGFKASIQCYGD